MALIEEELRSRVLGMEQGRSGLRALFHALGYDYDSGELPLPRGVTWTTRFTAPPCRIAKTCDGQLVALWFPLREHSPDSELALDIVRYFSAFYPNALYLFSDQNGCRWSVIPSGLPNPSPFLFSPSDTKVSVLRIFKAIEVSEEDGNPAPILTRIAEALTLAQKSLASSERRSREDRSWQDTYSWWLKYVGQFKMLTPKEELQLMYRVQRGDCLAREQVIHANLRLVVSLARNYQWSNIPLSDLIQEGHLGLIHAIDKFDWRRGFKLSTYATHWIRQTLGRAVECRSRLIRWPSYLWERISHLSKTEERLSLALGRTPNITEIAVATGFSVGQVRELKELQTGDFISLDIPVGEGNTPLSEMIPAEPNDSPGRRIGKKVIRNEINLALSHLTPREQEVLYLRYGLAEDAEAPMTLEQVGNSLNLSRERARQIEAGALQKLRRGAVGMRLRDTVVSSTDLSWQLPARAKLALYPVAYTSDSEAYSVVPPREQSADDKGTFSDSSVISHEVFTVQAMKEPTVDVEVNPRLLIDEIMVAESAIEIEQKTTDSCSSVIIEAAETLPFSNKCIACGELVEFKPTLNGKWYRCRSCKDTRIVRLEKVR